MKIVLIGNFSGKNDEGMKKISQSIKNNLSKRHEILAINSREIFKVVQFRKIKALDPDIIHYLHGPTIRSLFILMIVKVMTGGRAGCIASAVRPYFSKFSSRMIHALKPDLVLTQSYNFENFFKEKGCKVKFFPNGINCTKYQPATEEKKGALRKHFNLPLDKEIILHVGHIKANRNLEIFKKIQTNPAFQAVIVGSVSEKADTALVNELKTSGVLIYQQYFYDISKFYQLADLYLFPIKSIGEKRPKSYNQVGAIDLPLSVMEAMAVNLPVVTTAIGALRRVFQPGEGLFFCGNESEILPGIKEVLSCNDIQTRNKVLPLDWEFNIRLLEKTYQQILNSKNRVAATCLN